MSMAEKSEDMDVDKEKIAQESEKMECEEMQSGSEAAELTENTDSSGKAPENEKKPSITSESTSGVEVGSGSTISTDIPCEAVSVPDVATKVEDQITTVSEMSPPAKKTLLSNIKEFFSPPKDPKCIKEKSVAKPKASRSKSLSPSEKNPQSAVSDTSNAVADEAYIASEGEEEHLKKGNEKTGVMKSLRKQLSKIIRRKPSIGSESTNLVSDEETEGSTIVAKPEEKQSEAVQHKCELQWTENRQSLTEKPSLDGTIETDVPSTWSGGDVFPSDASSKHSETGENTSEGAAASSLVSSPEEKISDAQDKDALECLKKDCPSAEEALNVIENGREKQSCREENAEKQSNEDGNLETAN